MEATVWGFGRVSVKLDTAEFYRVCFQSDRVKWKVRIGQGATIIKQGFHKFCKVLSLTFPYMMVF